MAGYKDRADAWVAGVDGCRAGWLMVLWRPGTGEAFWRIEHAFSGVLSAPENPVFVAVDMPIGLAARGEIGGRQADREARTRLGARQSTVFTPPVRAALHAATYEEACTLNLQHTDPPRKIAKQSYNLLPKIQEIDKALSPALQARVFECHPELAFWALNDEEPVALPKKIKSRPNPEGLDARQSLLVQAGLPTAFLKSFEGPQSRAGRDDFLDACACAATAARRLDASAQQFPKNPPTDERGLRMEIWA